MKKTLPNSERKQREPGPYPGFFMTLLIGLVTSVYALVPFPQEPLHLLFRYGWFVFSGVVMYSIVISQLSLIVVLTLWLDKRYSWIKQAPHRIAGQVLAAWIASTGIPVFISWLWFSYLDTDGKSLWYAYYAFMLKAILDSATVLNAVYLILSFYGHYRKTTIDKPVYPEYLHIFTSATKTEVRILVSDIAYICLVKKGTLLLRGNDGSSEVFWDSLDHIQSLLDPDDFCRIGRRYVVSRRCVTGVRKCPDRSRILLLNPPSDQPVKVSRDKVAGVMKWLKGD